MRTHIVLFSMGLLLLTSGCKTRSELRREQEMEKIKQDVVAAKGQRADVEQTVEDLRTEVQRLATAIEEQAARSNAHQEELKKEIGTLTTRVQAIEQRAVDEEMAQRKHAEDQRRQDEERKKAGFDTGKSLYDAEKYDEAVDVFKAVIRNKPKTEEARRSQFYLAESLFNSKDFPSSTVAFGEYIKLYPKDSLVPTAVLRQGQAFRALGKNKEAKLFFQEVLERFPKGPAATKARAEMKKLK